VIAIAWKYYLFAKGGRLLELVLW